MAEMSRFLEYIIIGRWLLFDKKIFLTVTNRGEEIPKGEEEKIFERFYRID